MKGVSIARRSGVKIPRRLTIKAEYWDRVLLSSYYAPRRISRATMHDQLIQPSPDGDDRVTARAASSREARGREEPEGTVTLLSASSDASDARSRASRTFGSPQIVPLAR